MRTPSALLLLLPVALLRAEPGLDQLARLDQLPQLRDTVEVGAITSYDRTGGNDDGFSGKYSFVRQEGDGLVIAELAGPGVITRIATPTPTDDPIEFYFDGETVPRVRLKFRELFDGTHAPFLAPLVDRGHGGNWCYVPMPYAKSCRVVVRGPKVQFYQLNYARFAPGTPVDSFVPDRVAADPRLAQAVALVGRAGQDVSAGAAPAGAALQTVRRSVSVRPGETATLFARDHGGRIVGFRLGPTAALAGRDRGLVLAMTWDGAKEPAVLCPAGDFFGFSWGQPAMRALLAGSTDASAYCYFPMPFARSARLELRNERADGPAVELTAEIVVADAPRRADEGEFHAVWRRENPTTVGTPFTYVETRGRGHLVGVTLQAEGEKDSYTAFFEGDDRAVIDGRLAVNGTGSEDFFNGGWYDVPGKWERRISYPLNGCLDYLRPLGRSGGYRFLLNDAYAFRDRLVLTMEHAPENNALVTDYVGVSYLYLAAPAPPAPALPPRPARAVTPVDRLVFKPGWYNPPVTFSLEHVAVAKRTVKIGPGEHRVLSATVDGPEFLGEHHLAFFCDVPDAGRYRVAVELLEGPEAGGLQLVANGKPAGPAVHGRADTLRKRAATTVGEVDLAEGTNRLFFLLLPPAPAPERYRVEIETLTLDRVR